MAQGGLATYSYVDTNETLSTTPGVDRKLAIGARIGNSSSLDADNDSVWAAQAVCAIHRDEGGLAGQTIVPSLEAVPGV